MVDKNHNMNKGEMNMDYQEILTQLGFVVKHNYKQLEKVEGDQSRAKNLITLIHDDRSIYDPSVDESMMYEVDPIEYYGLDKINKMIKDYTK